eukprot:TRINITY_DN2782_c0_g1_i2.p1 TRINITY_DN2782_c0_g1~~TRINITY_DN2782_c0_g1_i2.p1  ORF type:complete len:625 (+),score=137.33 TRINITY_DN2782_c0_g1_i2:839-2713(+)
MSRSTLNDTDANESETCTFECENCPTLADDIKFVFYESKKLGKGGKVVFTAWISIPFVENNTVVLTKSELDKANKDKNHKSFHKDFRAEFFFKSADSNNNNHNSNNNMASISREAPVFSYLSSTTPETLPAVEISCGLLSDLLGMICVQAPDLSDLTRISSETISKAESSDDFQKLEEGIKSLTSMDLSSLKNQPRFTIAFWVNIFHLLYLYSLIQRSSDLPEMLQYTDRINFLNSTVHEIGGSSFSLLEILFCCLSLNLTDSSSGFPLDPPKFSKTDQRSQWSLQNYDTRLLCVIWQATPSSSLLRVYHPDTLMLDLDRYSKQFIDTSVEIDPTTGDVLLPMEFTIYYGMDQAKTGLSKSFNRWLTETLIPKSGQTIFKSVRNPSLSFPAGVFSTEYDWSVGLSLSHLTETVLAPVVTKEKSAREEQSTRKLAEISKIPPPPPPPAPYVPLRQNQTRPASQFTGGERKHGSDIEGNGFLSQRPAPPGSLKPLHSVDNLPVTGLESGQSSTTSSTSSSTSSSPVVNRGGVPTPFKGGGMPMGAVLKGFVPNPAALKPVRASAERATEATAGQTENTNQPNQRLAGLVSSGSQSYSSGSPPPAIPPRSSSRIVPPQPPKREEEDS